MPPTGVGVGGVVPIISANVYQVPLRPPCATTTPWPSSKSERRSAAAGQPGGLPALPPSIPPASALGPVPPAPPEPPAPADEPPAPDAPPFPVEPPVPPVPVPVDPDAPPPVVLPPAPPPSRALVPPPPLRPALPPVEPPSVVPPAPPRLAPAVPPRGSPESGATASSVSLHATTRDVMSKRRAHPERESFKVNDSLNRNERRVTTAGVATRRAHESSCRVAPRFVHSALSLRVV